MRALPPLLLARALTSGGGGPLALPALPLAQRADPAGPVTLYGGLRGGPSVEAAGPAGFCPVPEASNPRAGLAIFAPCDGGGTTIRVQAGRRGSAGVDGHESALVRLLGTPEGTAMLASDGRRVVVDEVEGVPGAVIVRFHRQGETVEEDQWRAFLDLGGRIVVVALRPVPGQPMAAEAGRALILQTVAALRQAGAAAGA